MSTKPDDGRIRVTIPDDIPRIVELSEVDSQLYAAGNANFYAVVPDYGLKKTHAVTPLIDSSSSIALIHETQDQMDGVLLGRLVVAPPVYKPGGPVCVIEDFLVVDGQSWPQVGAALADAAKDQVRQIGGVVLIVECMYAAIAKRELLLSSGYTVASDWYCRDINLPKPAQNLAGTIEPATRDDIPAIVDLCEQRRVQYEKYQPVFWRKAADSADKQTTYLTWLFSEQKSIILVHRSVDSIDGFIVANPNATSPLFARGGPSCNVDDFSVADDDQWDIGAWLLYTAATQAKGTGAVSTQVICGDADSSKRHMLEQLGYQIGHQWLVRDTT